MTSLKSVKSTKTLATLLTTKRDLRHVLTLQLSNSYTVFERFSLDVAMQAEFDSLKYGLEASGWHKNDFINV